MVWRLLICFSDNVGDERGQGDPRSSQDLPDPRMIEVAHLLPSISLFMWSEKFPPPPLPSIYKCDVIDGLSTLFLFPWMKQTTLLDLSIGSSPLGPTFQPYSTFSKFYVIVTQ